MKKTIEKVCKVLEIFYSYGIMLGLFAGGLTFFGYIVALCVGGELATQICTVIYKEIFPIIIIFSSCIALLGVVKMYLSGEVALSIEKKKKASKDKKAQRVQKEKIDVNESDANVEQIENENKIIETQTKEEETKKDNQD